VRGPAGWADGMDGVGQGAGSALLECVYTTLGGGIPGWLGQGTAGVDGAGLGGTHPPVRPNALGALEPVAGASVPCPCTIHPPAHPPIHPSTLAQERGRVEQAQPVDARGAGRPAPLLTISAPIPHLLRAPPPSAWAPSSAATLRRAPLRRNVAEWNKRNPQMRVVLGGTEVLNSESFLSALTGHAFPAAPVPSAGPAAPPGRAGGGSMEGMLRKGA
jgi:hypothetical protein